MIPVAIERIFHAVAITSVLSLASPDAAAQLVTTAVEATSKEMALDSPRSVTEFIS